MINNRMLPHTATIQIRTGEGAYGPAYSDPIQVQCFIKKETSLVRNALGEEVVSSAKVWLNLTSQDITPESLFTLGDRTYRVLTVLVNDDAGITGMAHQKVFLQ